MTTQQVKIDSISPIVTYVSNDPLRGWTSAPGDLQNADTHVGQPNHWTPSSNATLSFGFYGGFLRPTLPPFYSELSMTK
jgi:hypothetical protein